MDKEEEKKEEKTAKKFAVHMFDPEIYPRKLFVIKGKNRKYPDLISSEFETISGSALDTEGCIDTVGSCTWGPVVYKPTGKFGMLVWIVDTAHQKAKDMAHEADHVVNKMFKELGVDMSYDHDEHHAYMIGWVTDCLEQVRTGKFKY